jgi:DNA-binding HxlR family transcriptional regulator
MTTPLNRDNCSVKRALDVVGEKWTLLVLREAFYGARRFEQFFAGVGCSRNILSDRLLTLVEHDLLRRYPYREEGQRERHEYRLTDKGRELLPALVALMHWGDKWVAGPEGPPVTVIHRDCGQPVTVTMRCDGHDQVLAPRELAADFSELSNLDALHGRPLLHHR